MLAGALGAGIGGIGTQLFITESFHRDKAQAERTINFVRSIEKKCTGLYWKL